MTIRPEKIRLGDAGETAGDGEVGRERHDPRRALPRRRHSLPRHARRRRRAHRRSPEPDRHVERRAHRTRPPGRADLPARARAARRDVGRTTCPTVRIDIRKREKHNETRLLAALGLTVVLAVVHRRPGGGERGRARQERRQGEHPRLGRIRRGRLDRQGVRLGHPVREEDRLQGVGQDFNTSDEAFQLFQTGQYDVVSASGDSALRSIVNGDAAPINAQAA